MAGSTLSPQVEADKKLLKFKDYEEYLDSLVTDLDKCYLPNDKVQRTIAELGYRSNGKTLSRDEFRDRIDTLYHLIGVSKRPYVSFTENLPIYDPVHVELAKRERANRVGILSTIIFMSCYDKRGHEVSAYIDYAESLQNENWKLIFKGKNYHYNPKILFAQSKKLR